MVRHGGFTIADVKRALRKHWWIILACAVGGAALSTSVATQLPKKYMSQTAVLVAKPTVPAEYVKPVVTEDLNQRLASMKEQILSPAAVTQGCARPGPGAWPRPDRGV